jgi:heme/copper-type cytochrome/quinol oxidase subunit 3
MRERVEMQLAQLPLHGRGSASPTWWGTLTFMLLEGSGFAVCIGIYLYLLSIAPTWPIAAPAPGLGPGTLLTFILVASAIPNWLVGRWSHQHDLRKIRIGMVVMSLLGIAPVIVRVFEFRALNVWWDANAYGSILWLLLGLHTTHLVTDLADTLVLAVMMFSEHGNNRRRFGDVHDNVLYWNFVVVTWIPIYLCVYWIPRL